MSRQQRARTAFMAATVIGFASAGMAPAAAKAVYNFVGQTYTYNYPSNGCLTETMHLTMKITLPSVLAPNLSNYSVQAVSWVINDGLHQFKDSAKKAISPLQSTFSTDADGKIIAWSVNSYYYAKDGITLLYSTHSTQSGDYSDDTNCTVPNIASNFVPGTWKLKK
jgi:hypothetical protein